jgi:hypothetical protein
MNKILITFGLILGIGGIIFSLLPPDVHMALFWGQADSHNGMEENMGMHDESMEHDENMGQSHHNHGVFVTWGLIVAIIGLGIAFAGWKIFV